MSDRRGRAARVHLVTLGCAKNVADSDLLAGQMLAAGLTVVPDPGSADAIVLNTCAFLSSSQQESIDAVLEMAEHKKTRPDRRLIVVGCLAQRHGEKLLEAIPEIDMVVGPGEVHALAPQLLRLIEEGPNGGPRSRLGGMDVVEERWDVRVVSRVPHSAYVKVSEGCDRTCSFCVIPALRGPHRSRTRESIVREVQMLAASGVREVNLVAQELTAYGIDLYGRPALADLLRDLDSIRGPRWIRLLYTYPSSWSEDLFAAVRDLEHVCRYVDMPIQHVADRILKEMRRPGGDRTRRLLERVRTEIPGVAVRTTLIVGFPGETADEFEALLSFVRDFGFDHLGVFAYSREEGTDAARLPGQLPAKLKQERRARILEAQQAVSLARNRGRIGRSIQVMLEDRDPRGGWIGRHEMQAPEVDGVTFVRGLPEGASRSSSFMDAVVTSAGAYDLEARPENMEGGT